MDETLLISDFREHREAYLKANVTFALTYLKAFSPVISIPVINKWMSWVPS